MSAAEKISIPVTPAMKKTLEERVASGQFASASELIREALPTVRAYCGIFRRR